ncbi:acyloxyacyl hydrolase [Desulfovibrio inopinatus]|uniref:acyloxyacyl hydrolase n=1 Tax=Desulfovibrio inopinatus TaxID=102109 RepID=UPI0006866D07|nr:acyloxyacyl hydrolase [Desulfovibrio inopinatus]
MVRNRKLGLSSLKIVLFLMWLLWSGVAVAGQEAEQQQSKATDNTQFASQTEEHVPNRYGMALSYGSAFNSSEPLYFGMGTVFATFDYENIWHHPAPDGLRFKVEASAGGADKGFLASLSMFAQYFPPFFQSDSVMPYAELGIGGIYTDFQLHNQGLKVNFCPQVSIGSDFETQSGHRFFGAIRLQHISNANLHPQNRGINSTVFLIGMYF